MISSFQAEISGIISSPNPVMPTHPYLVDLEPARLNVYRNNYVKSISDALASGYPAIEKLVGTAFFERMVADYIQLSPPASRSLVAYGHDFPAFVRTYEPAGTVPYLAAVAYLDRAWLESSIAADSEVMHPRDFAAIDPDQLGRFTAPFIPSVRIVRQDWVAYDVWFSNRFTDGRTVLDVRRGSQIILFTRPDLEVVHRVLTAEEANFFELVGGGAPILTALEQLAQEMPDIDAASLAATLIGASILAGRGK